MSSSSSSSPPVAAAVLAVTLFSLRSCPHCQQLKQLLQRERVDVRDILLDVDGVSPHVFFGSALVAAGSDRIGALCGALPSALHAAADDEDDAWMVAALDMVSLGGGVDRIPFVALEACLRDHVRLRWGRGWWWWWWWWWRRRRRRAGACTHPGSLPSRTHIPGQLVTVRSCACVAAPAPPASHATWHAAQGRIHRSRHGHLLSKLFEKIHQRERRRSGGAWWWLRSLVAPRRPAHVPHRHCTHSECSCSRAVASRSPAAGGIAAGRLARRRWRQPSTSEAWVRLCVRALARFAAHQHRILQLTPLPFAH
jgi:hypothetical protein